MASAAPQNTSCMPTEDKDWWLLLREADRELADAREQHRKELRAADQEAIRLIQASNADHFAQLNENAERTIEERGHFVSVEAFDPFQQQVLSYMASTSGVSKGTDRTISWVIAGMGLFIAIVSIIVAVYANVGV